MKAEKNILQNIAQKTKDRAARTLIKSGEWTEVFDIIAWIKMYLLFLFYHSILCGIMLPYPSQLLFPLMNMTIMYC